jgi:tripartite-type tricarboxylate transporter receptor subunit TctC
VAIVALIGKQRLEILPDVPTLNELGIRRAELMPSATALTRVNDQAIRRALEQAGVEFIDAYNGGPGVRLRAPPAEK